MAGYSGTPLAQQLGIKPGSRVAAVEAPPGFGQSLAPLPAGAILRQSSDGRADVIVFFTKSLADLAGQFRGLKQRLEPSGGFWVAWPKRASGVATDLTENIIRAVGLAQGLVDNTVCAVDETWSGLRFVYRLTDRPSTTRAPAARPGRARAG